MHGEANTRYLSREDHRLLTQGKTQAKTRAARPTEGVPIRDLVEAPTVHVPTELMERAYIRVGHLTLAYC